MSFDKRDEIWNATWTSYYETYYQELQAEKLVLRWHRFDEASKIIIALTASSSALTGWALWSQPGFKLIWAAFAGIGAIWTIINKSLDVSRKITDWGSSRSQFSTIRIEFESLLNQMRFNPNFVFNQINEKLTVLRTRYADAYQKTQVDAFITNRLRFRVQSQLDSILSINN